MSTISDTLSLIRYRDNYVVLRVSDSDIGLGAISLLNHSDIGLYPNIEAVRIQCKIISFRHVRCLIVYVCCSIVYVREPVFKDLYVGYQISV
jgi:hypothetical protein